MKRKLFYLLLSLITALFLGVCTVSAQTAGSEDTVVFVNGSSTLEGDGDGSLENPYKNFNTAVASIADIGGTIVVTGNTDCTSTTETRAVITNSKSITVTSYWNGVDYRNGSAFARDTGFSGTYLSVGHLLCGPCDNPGKITIDKLNIVTPAWANWNICGHPFEITSDTKVIYWYTDANTSDGDSSGYYDDIKIQFMMTGNYINEIPEVFGELPELKVSAPINNASRVYLGAKKDVTIGGGSFVLNSAFSSFNISNTNTTSALTINGDVKIIVNNKLSTFATAGTLAAFNGNLTAIINPGATSPSEIPEAVRPTNGNWYLVNVAEGAVGSFGATGKDVILTFDDASTNNFAILENTTSGNFYAFDIENGTAAVTLAESGIYNMSYINAESVTVSFVDELAGNTISDVVTTAQTPVTIPKLANTSTHIFRGWTDEQNGTEVKYEAGAKATFTVATTLYAVWSDAPKYTVTFAVDGEKYADFVNIEGAKIEYPTEPTKEGYYFQKWDTTPEVIGTEDITINAVFVEKAAYGNVVYLDGTAQTDGDGTIGNPFNKLERAAAPLLSEGGTIVVMGVTEIQRNNDMNNSADILVTSLDPITGTNYKAKLQNNQFTAGAYLYNPKSTFLGNGTGKLTFDNIVLYAGGSWNFFNLVMREVVIGAGTEFYALNGTTINSGSPGGFISEEGVSDRDNMSIKATFGASTGNYGFFFSRAAKAVTVNSVDITFDAYVKFCFTNNNGVAATINGPVMYTVNQGGTGTKLLQDGLALSFGAKSYLSIITNNATVDYREVEALKEKTFRISSGADGSVTHTGKKGEYKVVSDTYNFAQLLDSDENVVSEAIIGSNGGILSASEYGEYTVSYSNKEIYTVTYLSQLEGLSDAMPSEYSAATDNTAALTFSLPSPESRVGYSFLGWAETADGEVVYNAGSAFTLSGNTTLYAVFEEIQTVTVTFKDDEGNVLHECTGYVGDALTFPDSAVLPWDYEKKLYGFKYSDDAEGKLIAEGALLPDGNKTAIPLWGDIPANETRVYVDGISGDDENDGKTPAKAVKTIAAAVAKIRESGGIIICIDGEITLTGDWNNSGDITLTSLDPLTGINYKATEISDDGLYWKDGAYLWHGAVGMGVTNISGSIEINNILLGTHANYQFINFDGHPFTLGKGISAFNRNADTGKITLTQSFYMRALGEINASNTNPEGITFTLNTLGNGATIYAVGKAANTIPAINITVDSEFGGTIQYGNNSGGGTTTLVGPARFTFNADLTRAILFPSGDTNPVQGNIYAIYNNNSTGSIYNIVQEEGYGVITVTSSKDAKITHGAVAGKFEVKLNEGYNHGYVKILDANKKTVQYSAFENGSASFELSEFGDYTAEYTDVSCHKITYVTGTDEVTIPYAYFEDGSEAELAAGLYRYGYQFIGWTDGVKDYTDGVLTMPQEDITLTAIWEQAQKYTVSFDANGFGTEVPESISDYAQEAYSLEKLSASGKTFLGWSTDKDAKIGVMNHVITETTNLYAIWSSDAAYTLETRFREDTRWQFQRYVVDVYLENVNAQSGTVVFNIDNTFLYELGRIPVDGIDSTLTKSGRACTLKWTGDAKAENSRVKIATVMLFFTEYGMSYDEVEKRTTDEIIAPLTGCLADEAEALCTANMYKGKTKDAVKVNGNVVIDGRESGNKPVYSLAKLYITDSFGDVVASTVLEGFDSDNTVFPFTTQLYPGKYTFTVEKGAYMTRSFDFTVSEACTVPDIVLYAGDTLDENGVSDGIVNENDFIRVLRGFSDTFPVEYKYAIDLDENGVVDVSDISIIKKYLSSKVGEYTVSESVDSSMKALDWSASYADGVVEIVGGSEKAVANAREFVSSEYADGSAPSIFVHREDYAMSDIVIGESSISEYKIRASADDELARKYAQLLCDGIAEKTGFILEITSDVSDKEIVIGETLLDAAENYTVYMESGKIFLNYGNEESADLGTEALLGDILGTESGEVYYTVSENASANGSWEVLTRFAVLADTHVGKGKVEANPDWEDYEGWLKPVYEHIDSIHQTEGSELDFVLSLGDNIDYGYDRTTADNDALRDYDYNDYLRTIQWLESCDPVNPIEGRAEGKIPHYELKGNHDPSGKLRFLDRVYWTTQNENGKKVAFIGFFTDYGGYPYIYGDTSTYFSYGKLSDETVEYVENAILQAVSEGAEHIVLSSHFGIAQDLGAPILPETGLGKIGALCEKYGVRLYFNGHEHDLVYTVRNYENVYDLDCSMTRSRYAIVEITTTRARITIYNRNGNEFYREYVLKIS